MKKIVNCIVVIGSFFFAGCASQTVAIPNQLNDIKGSNLARIYVLRPTIVGGAISMTITDNGQNIGKTGGKGYLCWDRQPGKAEICGKAENESKVTIDVVAGQVYYIHQHVEMGIVLPRNKLEVVSAERGQELLKKCNTPKADKKASK